jgi:biopolymer transport protein ExbD
MLQTGIDVQLPETQNIKESNAEQKIVISISKEGRVYYGSDEIKFSTIPARLKKDAKGPKDFIFLRSDKDVKWNYIVSVIDAIRGAGYSEIKLSTKQFTDLNKK